MIPKDRSYPVTTIKPRIWIGEERDQDLIIPIVAGPTSDLADLRCLAAVEHTFAGKGEEFHLWMAINGDGLLVLYTKIISSDGQVSSDHAEFIQVFLSTFTK